MIEIIEWNKPIPHNEHVFKDTDPSLIGINFRFKCFIKVVNDWSPLHKVFGPPLNGQDIRRLWCFTPTREGYIIWINATDEQIIKIAELYGVI